MKLLFLVFLSFPFFADAQNIGIGTTTPHGSAALDITSSDKGFLLPRLNAGQISSIPNPATGLIVYNTTDSVFFLKRDTGWVVMPVAPKGINATQQWNLSDNNLYNLNSGNVGIGTATPDINALLHVNISSNKSGYLVTGIFDAAASKVPNLGAGSRMMFYPGKSAFRAGYVNNTQWDDVNVGYNSTGFGTNTIAIGEASTAMGSGTTASGTFSATLGFRTFAKAFGSTSIGVYNDNSDAPPGPPYSTDRIFQIGNGDFITETRSNAMTVLRSGHVGIGTTTPHFADALLQVDVGNSATKGFLVKGAVNGSSAVPNLGAGSRMMFYPGKVVFRAGHVTGNQWDNVNTGSSSTAIGYNTTASGDASTAIGYVTTASGEASSAFGFNTLASGSYSTALGTITIASGLYSTALGFQTIAKATGAITMGIYNDNADAPTLTEAPTDRIFQIGNGSSSTRSNAITVLRNGKTGFGTTSPNSLLTNTSLNTIGSDLQGGSGSSLSWVSAETGYAAQFCNTGNTANDHGVVIKVNSSQASTFALDVSQGLQTSTGTSLFSVKANGNTGIGTNTPIQRLDVNGRVNISNGVIQKGSTAITSTSDLGLYSGVSGDWMRFVTTNAPIQFYTDGGAGTNQRMTIDAIGNIGIGIAAPTQKLHVVGNIHATGCVTASNLTCPSDIRFKKNVIYLTNALTAVMAIRPIYYQLDAAAFPSKGFDERKQIGFSAQELEKLFPEVVQTDTQGYKSVDYSRLTPVLVQAVKEQQGQIEQLKTKLEEVLELLKKK